jgi:hypothetical protein
VGAVKKEGRLTESKEQIPKLTSAGARWPVHALPANRWILSRPLSAVREPPHTVLLARSQLEYG